jgi:hypothetical protein
MVWQSRMGLFRRDAERYVAVWQSRTGSVRSNKARFGTAGSLQRIGKGRVLFGAER